MGGAVTPGKAAAPLSKMPFKSLAQEGYLHAHPDILGKTKLAEFDAATKGKHLPKHAKHGFTHTTVTHHHDGSHTVTHHHVDPEKTVEHAVPDHDGMMDSMQQHLSPEMSAASPEPPAMGAAAPMTGA